MPPWTFRPHNPTPPSGASETASTPTSQERAPATSRAFLNTNPYETPHTHAQNHSSRPSSPAMHHRTHLRSFSNPFPSLFGAKKKTDHSSGQDPFLDVIPNDFPVEHGLSRSMSPGRQRRPSAAAPDFSTVRRCMTCGHSNSFPSGAKGFRCGKCTTMNDLEPYYSSRLLQAPPGHGKGIADSLHLERVSVERTRRIIEQCILSFLSARLGKHEQSSESPVNHESPNNSQTSTEASPEPPEMHDKANESQHHVATPQQARRGSMSITRKPVPDSLLVPKSDAGNQAYRQRQDYTRTIAHGFAQIFHPLEDYIYSCFDNCDILNNSFLSPGTSHPRAASDGAPIKDMRSARSTECDIPLSQLEMLNIRVEEIAEKGSMWARPRPAPHMPLNDFRSPRRSAGLVNSKSPRLNWPELSEWYHLMIHAGDSWVNMWHRMKPTDPNDLKIWESVELSTLERTILESQSHLRMTLLRATEKLLQRPKRPLEQPDDIRFLLILLANPLLSTGHSPPKVLLEPKASTYGNQLKPPKAVDRTPSPRGGLTSPPNKRMDDVDRRLIIMKRIVGIISNLPNDCHHKLVSWFSRLSDRQFRRLVDMVGKFVTYRLSKNHKRRSKTPQKFEDSLDEFIPTFSNPDTATPAQLHSALQRDGSSKSPMSDQKAAAYSEDWQVKAAAKVMALLFRANSASHNRAERSGMAFRVPDELQGTKQSSPLVPINAFYNTFLDYADLITDFENWESHGGRFSFCQYSFFLSIWAKIRILEHDARRQMEAKAREAFFDNILGRKGTSQYLVLKVRRDCLVEDSLRGVSEVVGAGQEDIKKGLRIEFVGEEGVDAGGLRKEWFLLLVREVFDPLHGLFLYDDDSGYCYFNPYCFESSEQFFLVGLVLGLAIYNSTILDIALPPFAFRKLLASARPSNMPVLSTPHQPFRCTLDDLAEYRPVLAKGLRQLLEFEGDVEETFCRDFVVQVERYGETVNVPLCPGGEKRPVTNSNRREFVELYVRYLLDSSVSRQFEPFKRGFFTVCGGNALHLFRPEEIELLVRGSDEGLDIPSLRAVSVYENWPMANPDREPVVNWFWEFFARSSPRDQRKILGFITGSDRIPAMGATSLIIRLHCLGTDSERFPIARTCFNMLSLYRYGTRQKLESKLWRAVVESEGFGLK